MAKNRAKSRADWVNELVFRSVVLCRSATLYRNLEDALFPERLSPEMMRRLCGRICEQVKNNTRVLGKKGRFQKDETDPQFDAEVDRLVGLGLVTKAFAEHKAGAAIVGSAGPIVLYVNDEDHMTFRYCDPKPFAEQWRGLHYATQELSQHVPFAYSPVYGYLSANPDHAGTGLRLTCSFCFFGLFLMKELEAVLRGVERLGLEVSPVFVLSENEENPLDSPGCCYHLASTQTMGKEEDLIERMDRICAEVSRQEQNARLRLMSEQPQVLEDFVRRSVAIGGVAVQLSESEGIDIVNAMLVAMDIGVIQSDNAGIIKMLQQLLGQISGAALRAVQRECVAEADGDTSFDPRRARAALVRPVAMHLMSACLDGAAQK